MAQKETFKPNIEKLLKNEDLVHFVVEIHSYGKWFRILRLKNYKRTHDFIINECKNNEILIENDKSQYYIHSLNNILDIKDLFKGLKLYVQYERKGDYYSPKESTLTYIESLFDFWQRDLQQKKTSRRQIDGNIFTDKEGNSWSILKGQIPTQLDDTFIWLKKPEKGVHKIAPLDWFKGQEVNTTGMYPLELIRTEKLIAKVVPLDSTL